MPPISISNRETRFWVRFSQRRHKNKPINSELALNRHGDAPRWRIHICTMTNDQLPFETALRATLLRQGHTLLAASHDSLVRKLEAARSCDICLMVLGPTFGPREPTSLFSHTELELSTAADVHPGKVLAFAQTDVGRVVSAEQRELVDRLRSFVRGTFQSTVASPAELVDAVHTVLSIWHLPALRDPLVPVDPPSGAIMISSTGDLRAEREVVRQVVLQRGAPVIDYLHEPSESVTPLNRVISWAEKCSVLVLILGRRYGYISPIDGLSVTELEFITALRAGRPVLALLGSGARNARLSGTESLDQVQFIERVRSYIPEDRITDFAELDDLREKVNQLLVRLRDSSLTGFTPHVSESAAGRWYRRQLARWLDVLPQAARAEGLPFESAYIPTRLRLGTQEAGTAVDGRHAFATRSHDTVPDRPRYPLLRASDALRYHPRFVIRGDPGSGKTTLLRWYALHAPGYVTPVLVRLAHYALTLRQNREVGRPYSILDAIESEEERLALRPTAGGSLWRASLEQGHGLVLLDALDEVPIDQQPHIAKEILHLAQQVPPETHIVVTMRFMGVSAGLGPPFVESSIEPLATAQLHRIAERWLRVIYADEPDGASKARSRAIWLMDLFLRNVRIAEWASTPLLLSFLTALADSIPQDDLLSATLSKASIYRRILRLQLGRWATLDLRRGGRHLWNKERLLRALATECMRESQSQVFDESSVTRICAQLSQESDIECLPDQLLSELLQEDGTVIALEPGRYTFMHPTFLEYLAAVSLGENVRQGPTQKATREYLWGKRFAGQWTETLRLLSGILVRDYDSTGVQEALFWLRRLVTQCISLDDDPGHLVLGLALQSLGEIGKPPPSWTEMGGGEMERVIIATWIQRLLDAEQISFRARERLIHLACDVAYLSDEMIRSVIAQLMPIVQSDSSELRRAVAARALGALGERAPVEELRAIQPTGTHLREALASALFSASLGHDRSVEELVSALDDDGAQESAARELVALGDVVPIDVLANALLKSVEKSGD
jgi:hypothetical protein